MQGVRRCVHVGILRVDVEADSSIFIQILQGEVSPWAVEYEVRQL